MMMMMRRAVWLLVLSSTAAFLPYRRSQCHHRLSMRTTPAWLQPPPPPSSSTHLGMGLRSMIGGLKKRKDKDDDDDDKKNKKQETPPSPAPEVRPLRMGEDPSTKEVNVHRLDPLQESLQERINRVKSGQMTEEEKRAFLEAALTAGSTADSRKPLRQESTDDKKRMFASPFPSDSILRNFARGKPSEELESDLTNKKKKEYLDMVTNPDRFHAYKQATQASSDKGGVERLSGTDDRKTPIADIRDMTLKTTAPSPAPAAPEPLPATSASDPMPEDLGARLGAAAMAEESARKQAEAARREREERQRQERAEYERQAAELARQRSMELARAEAEKEERRRREQETKIRAEEEKKRAEKERLEQLMKAQEEYWNQKLAKEREARATQTSKQQDDKPKGKVAKETVDDNKPAPPEFEPIAPSPADVKAESTAPTSATTKTKGAVFNPDESDLLLKAEHDKEEDWEHNQETMERSSAQIRGKTPDYSHLQKEPDFLEEQARKKRAIDRQREEQLRRLKELNSPLPNPVDPASFMDTPIMRSNERPTGLMPSIATPPPRVPSEPLSPTRSTGAPLFGKSAANDRKSTPVTPEPAMDEFEEDEEEVVETVEVKESARPPPLSTFLGFNKPKAPARKASKKDGPIRMQLPLGEDEEEGLDARENPGMSIKDALKKTDPEMASGDQGERSKKWGVDMSRFTD